VTPPSARVPVCFYSCPKSKPTSNSALSTTQPKHVKNRMVTFSVRNLQPVKHVVQLQYNLQTK
ncbi:hypothetical protein M8C21_013163, partial [Ambrosia artemisiifolia]